MTDSIPPRLSVDSIGGLKTRRPQSGLGKLNMMVYGDSGTGKTLLAGTAAFVPELSPVLFVDVEGGTLTLNHFDDDADIEIIRVEEWKQIQKVYDELYKGKHPFKTVVIDSLTECQKFGMASHMNMGDDFDDVGEALPGFKEWYVNTEQIRRMIRAFRDLPVNTIFTALAMDEQDPKRESVYLKKPAFTKKLAGEVPAFFDVLLYMYVKIEGNRNVRMVQTDKDNRIVAKCRVKGIPLAIKDPTMETLYDMLIRNPKPVDLFSPATEGESTGMENGGGMMKKKSFK